METEGSEDEQRDYACSLEKAVAECVHGLNAIFGEIEEGLGVNGNPLGYHSTCEIGLFLSEMGGWDQKIGENAEENA